MGYPVVANFQHDRVSWEVAQHRNSEVFREGYFL